MTRTAKPRTYRRQVDPYERLLVAVLMQALRDVRSRSRTAEANRLRWEAAQWLSVMAVEIAAYFEIELCDWRELL